VSTGCDYVHPELGMGLGMAATSPALAQIVEVLEEWERQPGPVSCAISTSEQALQSCPVLRLDPSHRVANLADERGIMSVRARRAPRSTSLWPASMDFGHPRIVLTRVRGPALSSSPRCGNRDTWCAENLCDPQRQVNRCAARGWLLPWDGHSCPRGCRPRHGAVIASQGALGVVVAVHTR